MKTITVGELIKSYSYEEVFLVPQCIAFLDQGSSYDRHTILKAFRYQRDGIVKKVKGIYARSIEHPESDIFKYRLKAEEVFFPLDTKIFV